MVSLEYMNLYHIGIRYLWRSSMVPSSEYSLHARSWRSAALSYDPPRYPFRRLFSYRYGLTNSRQYWYLEPTVGGCWEKLLYMLFSGPRCGQAMTPIHSCVHKSRFHNTYQVSPECSHVSPTVRQDYCALGTRKSLHIWTHI